MVRRPVLHPIGVQKAWARWNLLRLTVVVFLLARLFAVILPLTSVVPVAFLRGTMLFSVLLRVMPAVFRLLRIHLLADRGPIASDLGRTTGLALRPLSLVHLSFTGPVLRLLIAMYLIFLALLLITCII